MSPAVSEFVPDLGANLFVSAAQKYYHLPIRMPLLSGNRTFGKYEFILSKSTESYFPKVRNRTFQKYEFVLSKSTESYFPKVRNRTFQKYEIVLLESTIWAEIVLSESTIPYFWKVRTGVEIVLSESTQYIKKLRVQS